jgi:hypothetical protein
LAELFFWLSGSSAMLGQEELHEVYAAIGGAIWHLQFLEDVLVTYVVMRLEIQPMMTFEQGQTILGDQRKTNSRQPHERGKGGGTSAHVADAVVVLEERNWLVHRSMHEMSDSMYQEAERDQLLVRVRTLSGRAIDLKKRLYDEVVSWMESEGFDVARAEAAGLAQYLTLIARTPRSSSRSGPLMRSSATSSYRTPGVRLRDSPQSGTRTDNVDGIARWPISLP